MGNREETGETHIEEVTEPKKQEDVAPEVEKTQEMEVEIVKVAGEPKGVQSTQKVEKEAGQEQDVAPEVEKMEEEVEQVVEPSTEEMGEKMDEEIEMEKDPAAEDQGVEKEKVEKKHVTGPTEEPEKAETTEAEPEEVVKKPEVVQIEDDEVHMVTLQEVLATIVPTPSKRTVKDDEEGTQQRIPKRRMRLLVDEPEESEEDGDEEERLLLEKKRKDKELAGPAQKKIRLASQTVTIREPTPTDYDMPPSAERREAEALTWGRRLKRREERKK